MRAHRSEILSADNLRSYYKNTVGVHVEIQTGGYGDLRPIKYKDECQLKS